MISGIGSMASYQMMASNSSSKAPPPPKDQNVFQLSDSDADGLVSQSELETLIGKMEEATGTSINAEEALTTYDADGDGGLSGEELFEMLSNNGFAPPQMDEGQSPGGEENGMQGPPPPPMDQAINAYSSNMSDGSDNAIATLLALLNGSETEETYSAIDTVS